MAVSPQLSLMDDKRRTKEISRWQHNTDPRINNRDLDQSIDDKKYFCGLLDILKSLLKCGS